MDCSLPGSSVCGVSQAKLLEWVAIFLLLGREGNGTPLPNSEIKPALLPLSHLRNPREFHPFNKSSIELSPWTPSTLVFVHFLPMVMLIWFNP